MPTVSPQTPTVAVQVPVPTPVQQQPRKPRGVSFPPPDGQAPPPPGMPGPTGATPRAVILPWTPQPKRMKRRRYGRVAKKAIHDFFRQGAEGGYYDAHNNSDAVFADYLEQNDDPRHEIIRRDLSYRGGKPRHFDANIDNHFLELGKGERIPYPAGIKMLSDGTTLMVNPHRYGLYRVIWYLPGDRGNTYHAAFSGEELHELMPRIMENDAVQHPDDSTPPPEEPTPMRRRGGVRRYADVQPFLEAHSQERDPTHLAALADKFDEEGDIRGPLLRRHLNNQTPFGIGNPRLPGDMHPHVVPSYFGAHGHMDTGWGDTKAPGGANSIGLAAQHLTTSAGGSTGRPTHVVVRWGRSVSRPPHDAANRRHWQFIEAFTPEEMREIADRVRGGDKIHEFMDKFFPRKSPPTEPTQNRRLPKKRVRYAGKRPVKPLTGSEYLFPEEEAELGKTKTAGLKTINANIRQGLGDRPGLMPGIGEIESLAQLGSPVRGMYRNQFGAMEDLVPHPEDAGRWATINAILSANSGFEEHTKDAIQALGLWHGEGKPTDPKGLERVFGKVVTAQATDPDTGEKKFDKNGRPIMTRQWVDGTGLWGKTRSVWGDKIDKIKAFLSEARQAGYAGEVGWEDVSKGSYKTPNFGRSFVDPKGTALDTHMARLLVPGRPYHLSALHQMALGLGSPKLYAGIKAVRDNLITNKVNYLAYKTLVGHAAKRLGWEPREVQEAVWTAVVGIMALKYADEGAVTKQDAARIIRKLNPQAVVAGWDIGGLLSSEAVTTALERMKISPKRLKHVIAQVELAKEEGVGRRVRVGNRDALESAARRIGAADLKTAAAVPIVEHLTGKTAKELAEIGRKKLARVRRYSEDPKVPSDPEDLVRGSYGHQNFVDRMVANPQEHTHALAYADWLEENDMPGMAKVVRDAISSRKHGQNAMFSFNPRYWPGQEVPASAGEGVPHAFALPNHTYETADPGYADVGFLFVVPRDKVREGNPGDLWPDTPRGFYKTYPAAEAHRIASEMRDNGVANAEAAVAALEKRFPHLVPQKLSRHRVRSNRPCPSSTSTTTTTRPALSTASYSRPVSSRRMFAKTASN